uniref:Putative CDC60-leucine-tRNA ligase, cytosolic n=1 Tax=Moniliophthora roreri TaxID=221103 RepID=A0A0W0FUJ1_MONRR
MSWIRTRVLAQRILPHSSSHLWQHLCQDCWPQFWAW